MGKCEVCWERIGYGGCMYNQRGYLNPADHETDKDAAKHYRLGYERSQEALAAANARADAAVAEIVNEQRRFGEMQREAWRLDESLAAARRECEGLRAMLRGCRPLVAKAHVEANEGAEEGWFDFLHRIEAALAAPAAGEEG